MYKENCIALYCIEDTFISRIVRTAGEDKGADHADKITDGITTDADDESFIRCPAVGVDVDDELGSMERKSLSKIAERINERRLERSTKRVTPKPHCFAVIYSCPLTRTLKPRIRL